ncbi:Chondroitinase-B precursor [Stieleria neptunia]|uniref:Chondroitinase-B n=1 Tax=Stieleria neptunia TaxID=2527979 RepID=A0A518I3L6_9BACT|nr:polysaccharide lyase 6 family protein [Stieleria neptunia]QDV47627.1 Chondroitinase-B precursor [Stieleria neptunia]
MIDRFGRSPVVTSVALLLGCLAALLQCPVLGKEFLIEQPSELKSVLRQIAAGDSIVLADGDWQDAKLTFDQLPGTQDAPISIRPQRPGGVVFSGATEFRVSGTHVEVSGFAFVDPAGVSDVVQLRTHSQRLAHHCRITNCSFEQTADSDAGIESRWLSIYGTHNRVDHCYFGGKKSRGTTLVVWVRDVPEHHRIDHNQFGPRPELGRNGGETIRIGTSEVSEFECASVVEDNYFYRCDGEAEIVSNKSCGNIYRHNVFDSCAGALTLRHGHRCLVDGNLFLGRKQRGTGGVRLIGQDHRVTNNYFEGLRGDAERAALCMMNGVPNGALNSYAPVRGALVAHNTFIDCKVSMEIGVGAGKEQSANPSDCQIIGNVLMPLKWQLFRIHADPKDFVWRGNLQQHGKGDRDTFLQFPDVELTLQRAADGLLRPIDARPLRCEVSGVVKNDIDDLPRGATPLAGCDDPATAHRVWASAENTGPTW